MSDAESHGDRAGSQKGPRKWLEERWGGITSAAAVVVALVVLAIASALVVAPAYARFRAEADTNPTLQIVTVTKVTAQGTEITTTRQPSSVTDRLLGGGTILLIDLGIAALAAFLAGALTQRVLRARFAITLGPLQFAELEETTGKAVRKLQARTDLLDQKLAEASAATTASAAAIRSIEEDVETLASQFQAYDGDLQALHGWGQALAGEVSELQEAQKRTPASRARPTRRS